jgi:XTP/dITP diphosphohydrolase
VAGQKILPATVVLATGNRGKLAEIRALPQGTGRDVLAQDEFAVPEVAETGASFVENAIIKARHAARHSGHPALADDSGLEVDCLSGRPGVYSARYAGEGAGNDENIERLLAELRATGHEQPTARFRCCAVYLRSADDPAPLIADGTWEGWILPCRQGSGGFGYDPVFYVPTHGCAAAELDPEIKNAISHRGKAFRYLLQRLEVQRGARTTTDPQYSPMEPGGVI